jgi:amino acid transporter
MQKLRVTQRLANGVFIFYGVVVLAVLAAGIVFALDNGAAVPFHLSDAATLDFGTYGWIFGVVLLYLLGVETPFNMGAEFRSTRSAGKMVWYGSLALAIGYILATIGVLLTTPVDQVDPITGVAKVFGLAGSSALQSVVAIGIAVVLVTAFATYQSAYSRLIFVSGLERHLPRLFTHLNARTRNPVTALLLQGVVSSVLVIILYSQQSLTTVFLSLQGALTVLWLASGYFFLLPVAIARFKYPARYAEGSFWRIPGGKAGAIIVSAVGVAGTTAGIYYTFTLPFSADIPKGTWMTNLGIICAGTLVCAAIIYVLGRRSATKLSDDDRLAHLATLEPVKES